MTIVAEEAYPDSGSIGASMTAKLLQQLIAAVPRVRLDWARHTWLPTVLGCALVAAFAAGVWSILFPGSYTASQSLVVRDDLLGDSYKPGRFNSLESMKSAQETIFHIARKPEVIAAAASDSGLAQGELSPRDIEEFQGRISLASPNGGELGKTEVFVLRVKQSSGDRASQFLAALTSEIEKHLRVFRTDMLTSMQSELSLNLDRSETRYQQLAGEIRQIEAEVGPDLQSLRAMVDPLSGGTDLQRTVEQLRTEIRSAQNECDRVTKQIELVELVIKAANPDSLTTSNELLELQPVLKRLNEGLVDARLSLSRARGAYDDGHPSIEIAKAAVEQTVEQIRAELVTTAEGLLSQKELHQQKISRLLALEQDYSARVLALGKLRVSYKTLNDELVRHGETLAKTRTELATIASLAESSNEVNLITRVGRPHLAARPDGLSKRAMILLGFVGGGLLGLGWSVLRSGPVNFFSVASNLFATSNETARSAPARDMPVPVTASAPSPVKPAGKPAENALPDPAPAAPADRIGSLIPSRFRKPPAEVTPSPGTAIPGNPELSQTSSARPAARPEHRDLLPAATALPELAMAGNTPEAAPASAILEQLNRAAATARPAAPPTVQQQPARPMDVASAAIAKASPAGGGTGNASEPPVRPGMMTPTSGMRPGQVLKTSDLIRTPPARSLPSHPIAGTAGLQTSNPVSPNPRPLSEAQGPASQQTDQNQLQETLSRSELNKTVNTADLEIEAIRRQLQELDPSMSFDVFCESIKLKDD